MRISNIICATMLGYAFAIGLDTESQVEAQFPGLQEAYDECQEDIERRATDETYDEDCQTVEMWYSMFFSVATETQQDEDVDDEDTQDGDNLGP